MVPGQGEPGFDGRKVLRQALGAAAERLNPAIGRCGHPRVKRVAPALPHERQKGLAQLRRLGLGYWVSQAATLAAERSGNRSTTR